jgi:hypothetical protein
LLLPWLEIETFPEQTNPRCGLETAAQGLVPEQPGSLALLEQPLAELPVAQPGQ